MACPGGCIAGAGTLQPINKSTYSVGVAMKEAPVQNAVDSQYADILPHLERIQEELAKAKEEEIEPVNRAKVNSLAYK
jgi:iron only hydrogenase large subunit-like protein